MRAPAAASPVASGTPSPAAEGAPSSTLGPWSPPRHPGPQPWPSASPKADRKAAEGHKEEQSHRYRRNLSAHAVDKLTSWRLVIGTAARRRRRAETRAVSGQTHAYTSITSRFRAFSMGFRTQTNSKVAPQVLFRSGSQTSATSDSSLHRDTLPTATEGLEACARRARGSGGPGLDRHTWPRPDDVAPGGPPLPVIWLRQSGSTCRALNELFRLRASPGRGPHDVASEAQAQGACQWCGEENRCHQGLLRRIQRPPHSMI